jgi:hypothetical protein
MEVSMKSSVHFALPVLALIAVSAPAFSQPALTLPDPSPKASVSQRIGLTDIVVTYNRPVVNKRRIWGGLVPYGEVWRAGANENTTISFSTPVTVLGKPLIAGKYGFHVLSTTGDWTLIFSTQNGAWGSFSYDDREDAARVTVKPEAAEFQESLGYTFEDPTRTSVRVVLRWEKLRVSFPVEVDTNATVLASIRQELRGLARFGWQGWNQAATFCGRNNVNTDEALTWVDRSLGLQENFQNLRTKATLLEQKGDKEKAAALRDKAMKIATEGDLNQYAYGLMLNEKKVDEAIEIFKRNVREHPASWNVYDSLAEAWATKGDKKLAVENYTKALGMAPEDQKKRISGEIAKMKE